LWWFYEEETEYLLVDCHYSGILMVSCGDAMKDEQSCGQSRWGTLCTIISQQIKLLNEGKYLHDVIHDNKADFCIGAGYPEKHLESPSLLSDLKD
jgi:methylenetetrahydrofolate reductase (NADPH)